MEAELVVMLDVSDVSELVMEMSLGILVWRGRL